MTDLETTRRALEESYRAIEALGADLTPAEWDVPSSCPDWTVRDVVAHLAAVEHVLTGWLPPAVDEPPPFRKAAELQSETSQLDAAEFLERVRTVFDARRQDLAELSAADLERPSFTPVGPATYGRFLEIRVFDFWVHERDISVPLGRPTDDAGPRAEIALDEVHGSLGYIVGKKIGLPDGTSIAIHVTGPVQRKLCAVVDGRARVVDDVAEPDVEVTVDTLTFLQLACGRVDPQQPIEAGRIRWSGDEELGERAARNLRFTM